MCRKDEIQQAIRNCENLHAVEIGSAWKPSIEFVQECLAAIARKSAVCELTLRRFSAETLPESFVETLAQIRSVKELNLMGLSNEQIRMFASWAITANLTKFQIINTYVDTTCLRVVGDFLAASTTIKEVFLCVDNAVSDAELLLFCERCWNNYSLCFISLHHLSAPFSTCDLITSRNRSIQWPTVLSEMRDAVIGLFPFQLPLYTMLWIIDWFPYIAIAHKEYKKVTALQRIYESCDAAATRCVVLMEIKNNK